MPIRRVGSTGGSSRGGGPGGGGSIHLASAYVSIMPETSKVAPGVRRAAQAAGQQAETAIAGSMASAFQKSEIYATGFAQHMASQNLGIKQGMSGLIGATENLTAAQANLDRLMKNKKATAGEVTQALSSVGRAQRAFEISTDSLGIKLANWNQRTQDYAKGQEQAASRASAAHDRELRSQNTQWQRNLRAVESYSRQQEAFTSRTRDAVNKAFQPPSLQDMSTSFRRGQQQMREDLNYTAQLGESRWQRMTARMALNNVTGANSMRQSFHSALGDLEASANRSFEGMRRGMLDAFGAPLGVRSGAAGLGLLTSYAAFSGVDRVISGGMNRLETIQNAQVAMNTILGNQKEASDIIQKTVALAQGTPYGADVFLQMARNLTTMGVQSKEVTPAIEALANAAAVMGRPGSDLDALSRELGKIKTEGRIMGRDVLELQRVGGINARTIIANHMNMTGEELTKQMGQKGGLQVNPDEIIQWLTEGIMKGSHGTAGDTPAYGGGMQKMREQTFTGAKEVIKSQIDKLGAAFLGGSAAAGGGPVDPNSFFGRLPSVLNNVSDQFRVMSGPGGSIDAFMHKMRGGSASGTPLWARALEGIPGLINSAMIGIGKLQDALHKPATQAFFQTVGDDLKGIWGVAKDLLPTFMQLGGTIAHGFAGVGLTGLGLFKDTLVLLAPVLRDVAGFFGQNKGLTEGLIAVWAIMGLRAKAVELGVAGMSRAMGVFNRTVHDTSSGAVYQQNMWQRMGQAYRTAATDSEQMSKRITASMHNVGGSYKLTGGEALRDSVRTMYAGAQREATVQGGRLGNAMRGSMRAASVGLRDIGGGLMGALGGPWGLAITGAIGLIGFLAAKHSEAAEKAREQAAAEKELHDTLMNSLQPDTGAITADTKSEIGKKLVDSGTLTAARQSGLDPSLIINAITDQTDAAYDKLKEALAKNPLAQADPKLKNLTDQVIQYWHQLHQAQTDQVLFNEAMNGTWGATQAAKDQLGPLGVEVDKIFPANGKTLAVQVDPAKREAFIAQMKQFGLDVQEVPGSKEIILTANSDDAQRVVDGWVAKVQEGTIVQLPTDANTAPGDVHLAIWRRDNEGHMILVPFDINPKPAQDKINTLDSYIESVLGQPHSVNVTVPKDWSDLLLPPPPGGYPQQPGYGPAPPSTAPSGAAPTGPVPPAPGGRVALPPPPPDASGGMPPGWHIDPTTGSLVPGSATGGRMDASRILRGPGTGTSDSIFGLVDGRHLVKVSSGESVNTFASTKANWPWIDAMNKGLELPHYDTGGKFPPDPNDPSNPLAPFLQYQRGAAPPQAPGVSPLFEPLYGAGVNVAQLIQQSVNKSRANLDQIQAKADQQAGTAIQGGGPSQGGSWQGTGESVFGARHDLAIQNQMLLDANRTAAGLSRPTTQMQALPPDINKQSWSPGAFSNLYGTTGAWDALNKGSYGFIPNYYQDIRNVQNWSNISTADKWTAGLDFGALIPIPGMGFVTRGVGRATDWALNRGLELAGRPQFVKELAIPRVVPDPIAAGIPRPNASPLAGWDPLDGGGWHHPDSGFQIRPTDDGRFQLYSPTVEGSPKPLAQMNRPYFDDQYAARYANWLIGDSRGVNPEHGTGYLPFLNHLVGGLPGFRPRPAPVGLPVPRRVVPDPIEAGIPHQVQLPALEEPGGKFRPWVKDSRLERESELLREKMADPYGLVNFPLSLDMQGHWVGENYDLFKPYFTEGFNRGLTKGWPGVSDPEAYQRSLRQHLGDPSEENLYLPENLSPEAKNHLRDIGSWVASKTAYERPTESRLFRGTRVMPDKLRQMIREGGIENMGPRPFGPDKETALSFTGEHPDLSIGNDRFLHLPEGSPYWRNMITDEPFTAWPRESVPVMYNVAPGAQAADMSLGKDWIEHVLSGQFELTSIGRNTPQSGVTMLRLRQTGILPVEPGTLRADQIARRARAPRMMRAPSSASAGAPATPDYSSLLGIKPPQLALPPGHSANRLALPAPGFGSAKAGEEYGAKHWPFTRRDNPFTPDEMNAIEAYVSSSDYLNGPLRGGIGTVWDKANPDFDFKRISPDSLKLISGLDSAIKKSPRVPSDIHVTRNGDVNMLDKVLPKDLDSAVGRVFHDPGYMSTSMWPAEPRSSPAAYVLDLKVPAGTHGIFLGNPGGPLSDAHDEAELLLGRGNNYVVTGITHSPSGGSVIHANLTPPGYYPRLPDLHPAYRERLALPPGKSANVPALTKRPPVMSTGMKHLFAPPVSTAAEKGPEAAFTELLSTAWMGAHTFNTMRPYVNQGAMDALHRGYGGIKPDRIEQLASELDDFTMEAMERYDWHTGVAHNPEDIPALWQNLFRTSGREIVSRMVHSPLSQQSVYRGTQWAPERLASLNPGSIVSMYPSSFTKQAESARLFTGSENLVWQHREPGELVPVMLRLSPGAKLADMSMETEDLFGRTAAYDEHLAMGNFAVRGMRGGRHGEPSVVILRQLGLIPQTQRSLGPNTRWMDQTPPWENPVLNPGAPARRTLDPNSAIQPEDYSSWDEYVDALSLAKLMGRALNGPNLQVAAGFQGMEAGGKRYANMADYLMGRPMKGYSKGGMMLGRGNRISSNFDHLLPVHKFARGGWLTGDVQGPEDSLHGPYDKTQPSDKAPVMWPHRGWYPGDSEDPNFSIDPNNPWWQWGPKKDDMWFVPPGTFPEPFLDPHHQHRRGVRKFGSGGYARKIRGAGHGTSDSILGAVDGTQPIAVSNGESINTAAATSANWPLINAMNHGFRINANTLRMMGVPGYKVGVKFATDTPATSNPRYGGIPSEGSGAGQDIVDWLRELIQNYNSTYGTDLSITGDFPGGPAGHSDDGGQHSTGHAVDVGGSPQAMAQFAQWWASNPQLMGYTRQLIHNSSTFPSSQNILGGQFTEGSKTYADVWKEHADHVHLALQEIPPAASGADSYANYGGRGVTPAHLQALQNQLQNATEQVTSTQHDMDIAQQHIEDLKTHKKPAPQAEVDRANETLRRATENHADALGKVDRLQGEIATAQQEGIRQPGQRGTGTGAETGTQTGPGGDLGKMFVDGMLQSFGFDGSVFSDPRQWAGVKSIMALMSWFMKPIPTNSMAAQADQPGGLGPLGGLPPGYGPMTGAKAGDEHGQIVDSIVQAGMAHGANKNIMQAAVMAGMQESGLTTGATNGPHLGPFQMDAAKGTEAQRRDPEFAANWWMSQAMGIPGAANMDPGALAQAVEKSDKPGAYGPHSAEASKALDAAMARAFGGDQHGPATQFGPGPGNQGKMPLAGYNNYNAAAGGGGGGGGGADFLGGIFGALGGQGGGAGGMPSLAKLLGVGPQGLLGPYLQQQGIGGPGDGVTPGIYNPDAAGPGYGAPELQPYGGQQDQNIIPPPPQFPTDNTGVSDQGLAAGDPTLAHNVGNVTFNLGPGASLGWDPGRTMSAANVQTNMAVNKAAPSRTIQL